MSHISRQLPSPRAGQLPRRRLLGVALACAFPASALHAQAVPEDTVTSEQETVYLAPLVTIGDAADKPQDPYLRPAAASAITADQVDLLGNQNLDDALRTAPGTFTRDNVQNPGVAVNIRGMEGAGRVNMSIDGIRQNFRFVGHEALGFAYVDNALLAGVEVERGVVSGVGGAGALAGRANFRTVGVDDVLGDRDFGGFAKLGYGGNEVGYSQALAAGARFGDLSFVAAVSQRKPDDYENGNGVTVPNTGQDLSSGLLKIRYQPGQAHRLDFGAVVYDNDFAANSYNQNINSRQYSANYAYTPDSDLVDLRVNIYRSGVRMTYYSPVSAGSNAGRRIEDVGTGFDLSNVSRFGDGRVSITYGAEYFHDDVDVVNSAAQPAGGVNGPGESTIASVFADTAFHLGPASLIAGLRYERFSLEGKGSVTAGNPAGLPAGPYEVDRSDNYLSPKLTLAVDATRWLQPYVSWGKSARTPSVAEVFVGGEHPGTGGMSFFPNPFLEPEKLTATEAGFNIVHDGLFATGDLVRLKVNYFRNEVDNYVTASFVGGTHFANVDGESKVKGFEVEGVYDAGFVFANVSYSDTDSELPSQVNGFGAQSYQPENVASATLGARFLERRLTLGASYFHASRSFIGEINDYYGNPWEPGYSLLNVFANYRLNGGIELGLNVSNIGDKAYTPALSTSPGGAYDTGRGRTATFSLKFGF